MAVILVLLVLGLIVPMTLDLNRASRAQVHEAANLAHGLRALYIAKSGVHLGEALLREDDSSVDSLEDTWAQAEVLSAQSMLLFSEGSFLLKIEDESGKIPINHLVEGNEYGEEIRDVLTRLLRLPGFNLSEEDIRDLVDALKDWIDSDDDITGFGAENSYYRSLGKSYACGNGPFERVEELRLVRGVTAELFEGKEGRPGLRDCLTVYGDGKININTAPLSVVRALSADMDEERARAVDEYRKNPEKDLGPVLWYEDVPGMGGIVLPAVLTTSSSIFRLSSEGRFRDIPAKVIAVVRRGEGKSMEILDWRES